VAAAQQVRRVDLQDGVRRRDPFALGPHRVGHREQVLLVAVVVLVADVGGDGTRRGRRHERLLELGAGRLHGRLERRELPLGRPLSPVLDGTGRRRDGRVRLGPLAERRYLSRELGGLLQVRPLDSRDLAVEPRQGLGGVQHERESSLFAVARHVDPHLVLAPDDGFGRLLGGPREGGLVDLLAGLAPFEELEHPLGTREAPDVRRQDTVLTPSHVQPRRRTVRQT